MSRISAARGTLVISCLSIKHVTLRVLYYCDLSLSLSHSFSLFFPPSLSLSFSLCSISVSLFLSLSLSLSLCLSLPHIYKNVQMHTLTQTDDPDFWDHVLLSQNGNSAEPITHPHHHGNNSRSPASNARREHPLAGADSANIPPNKRFRASQ